MTFVDKVRNDDPLGYYMAENMMLSETVGKMGTRIETLEAALRDIAGLSHGSTCRHRCAICIAKKALEGDDER